MWTVLALALWASFPDVPRAAALLPTPGPALALAAAAETPPSLLEARKLADQLRYEDAVLEYQRYLALGGRPARERAEALVELGFIHLVLGDEAIARARGFEALEADAQVPAPPGAPTREVEWLTGLRREFEGRARVQVQPRRDGDPALLVRAQLLDPGGRVQRVLLRYARAAGGPFDSVPMRCEGGACEALLPPPPAEAKDLTAWYWVEALDDRRDTVARAAGPDAPLQLAVVGRRAWYQSPVFWGVSGAALVAVAAVVFVLAPAPPR